MMNEDKNIKYINKTFSDFKLSLQEFAKSYFSDTYNDFSESSPGNMFIEMASYIGDVSSFYVDSQIQENFLLLAKEKESLYNLAYSFGYRPKASYASNTTIDVYQLIPSVITGSTSFPNIQYSLKVPENTVVTSNIDNQKFLTISPIDFSETGSAEISFVDNNYFLLKKSVPAISADIVTTTFTFGDPIKFNSVTIENDNIIQILDVTDSDGSRWYEVPYLAQETIFTSSINPASGSDNIDYLLNLKRVARRFVTRLRPDNKLELQFGSGISNTKSDTNILPTPDNINLGLISSVADKIGDYNKSSIFFTKNYGLVPQNTTLTIRYLSGGGISSNVETNTLTTIDTTNITFKYSPPDNDIKTNILNNIVTTNPIPATGGRGADTIEEIRLNALNSFSAQQRAVTKEDYIVRVLNMPSEYGNIAKAYMTQETYNGDGSNYNPLSLDLYILGYNSNKQLVSANTTLKNNLKKYLNEYRIITDSINIKDAYYINIGIEFDIFGDSNYNNKELLSSCLTALKNYFIIDSWQINQPIVISEINTLLLRIPGVQSIGKVEITNKNGGDYSPYGYDIMAATRNGILYPSIDPSMFEIRFPDTDIKGRIITY
jgi:hypothetical protein